MEDPNGATFAGIGGLSDQIRELREVCGATVVFGKCSRSSLPLQVIELPLMNPELFLRVGIKPPKGTLSAFKSATCADTPPQVSYFTDLPEPARPFSPVPSPRRSRPTSSRSSRPPSSTSTSARVHALFARCLGTQRSTSRASFSWTRSMRLVEGGSARARRPTGRFRGL